jgi:alkylation response protein AidB-like acyl-CoA dehydrogenase
MSDPSITTGELRDSIHEVLSADSDWPLVRTDPVKGAPARDELWRKMASLGWFGIAIPEQYGGLGLGFRELLVLYEELGQFLTPLPVMTSLLAADSIAMAGSEEQKLRWLIPLASGTIRATLALPVGIVELPRLDDDNLVHGVVPDVLYVDRVDEVVLPVQHSSGRLYLAIVGCADAGIVLNPRPAIDLTRTLGGVRLAGARVTADRLLPLDEQTWTRVLDHASLSIACDAVGGATRILADTVAYLGERRQFDRPIGSFQALKHRVATWKVLVEGISALTRHCAELHEDGDATRSGMSSAAKAASSEVYAAVAGDAIQLHGGIGFTWEHECHLFLKRASLNATLFGGVIQHKDRAAEFAFAGAMGQCDRRRRLLFHRTTPVQAFFNVKNEESCQ